MQTKQEEVRCKSNLFRTIKCIQLCLESALFSMKIKLASGKPDWLVTSKPSSTLQKS